MLDLLLLLSYQNNTSNTSTMYCSVQLCYHGDNTDSN